MRLFHAVPAAVVLGIILVGITPGTSFAQSARPEAVASVPRLITITGAFQPADGQPPPSDVGVTFSIYADQEGGTALWQESQTVSLDKAGRFTLLLGSTQADGISPDVFTAHDTLWLGMQFARPGEVERPRVRLASVPYALRAANADTLGGRPASAYVLAPSSGDTSLAPAGARTGHSADASAASTDVVLAGTPNRLAKYVNTADVGDSAVYEAGGLVGVGTTSPLDGVHVQFTNTGGSMTGLAVQNLGNTAASYSGMLFYDQAGALGQFQGFNNVTHEYRINNIARNGLLQFDGTINFMVGSTSRFFVSAAGNIGMGTNAPATNLEVSNAFTGTATANIWPTTFGNTTFGSEFAGRKARGSPGAPTAVQSGDPLAFFGGRGYGSTGFGAMTGAMVVRASENWTDAARGTAIQFSTTPNGTSTPLGRVAIDQAGNVGVGTFAPLGAVDVVRVGDTDVVATSVTGESHFFTRVANGTPSTPTAIQLGDSLGVFGVGGYGATGFHANSGGMAGFAMENWTDAAAGTALVFGATPLGTVDPQVYMAVLPDGNVGIGTPAGTNNEPTALDKLQVFGDIRVGTSGVNGCLKNFAGTGLIGVCSSDRRLKKNITPFAPSLDRIAALQPVHYNWRASEFPDRHFGDDRAYGLIAQDVEQVLPELVVTDKDGYKAVDYSKLPLLTIQAVKELKAENDALKQRLSELERIVTEMQGRK
jgi:Chaperone of endosialidase